MKKLIMISVLILFTILVTAQDYYVKWAKEASKVLIAGGLPDYHGLIVEQANKEWNGDYSMIAYEIKNQCKAWHDFLYMEKSAEMPQNTFEITQATALNKWSEFELNANDEIIKFIKVDWVMAVYEFELQIKAYIEIF